MPSSFDAAAWSPLLFILLAIVVLQRVLGARYLRSIVFRPVRRQTAEWEELPLYLRERVAAMHPGLADADFAPVGGERVELIGTFLPVWQWKWLHGASGTMAELRVNDLDPSVLGADVWSIDTAFADGSGISTTNEPLVDYLPKSSPRWQVENRPGEDLAVLWARHVERVQAHATASGAHSLNLAPEEARIVERGRDDAAWEAFIGASDQFVEKAGGLRLRWGWILRHGSALVQREQKSFRDREKIRRKRALAAPPGAAAPTEFSYSEDALDALDLNVFHLIEAIKRARRLSPRGRGTVTLVSLAVFAALLAWRGQWKWAAIISGVLVFHEAGHWIAMRIFGSRDTSMLFIPFFGSAAIQHDRPNLKPWQHAVILLAGPLPGLILGLAVVAWAVLRPAPAWIEDTALVLIALNAFNLLVPLLPLDGGQLVNIALFSRAPRLAVVFKAVSGLALIACSVWLGLGPLLWLLGLAFLIRVPLEWRTAAAHRELRQEAKANPLPADAGEDDWLRRIFRRLRRPGLARMRSLTRHMEALRLVMLVQHPGAGLGTALFALAGWLAPLWLPVVGLWFVQWQGARDLARVEEEARVANLPRPAGVRRERIERARTLPPNQNAAELLAQFEARADAREKIFDKHRDYRGGPRTPLTPEEWRQNQALELEIFQLLDQASLRPGLAYASDESSSGGRVLLSSGRLRTFQNAMVALATGAAVNLQAGYFSLASRQADAAVRLIKLLATSAEPHSSHGVAVLLAQCLTEFETSLAQMSPSPEAPAALEKLGSALPESDWVQRTLLALAPRERAWIEADLFEPGKGQPSVALSIPAKLLRFLQPRRGEASPFAGAQRARFVADSLRIQSSLTDQTPWGWDPVTSAGRLGGSVDAMTSGSTSAWRTQREMQIKLVARVRLACAAVAWHRARLAPGGVAPTQVEDLRAPFLTALPRHPVTDELARLERGSSGALQLAFRSTPAVTWQLSPASTTEKK